MVDNAKIVGDFGEEYAKLESVLKTSNFSQRYSVLGAMGAWLSAAFRMDTVEEGLEGSVAFRQALTTMVSEDDVEDSLHAHELPTVGLFGRAMEKLWHTFNVSAFVCSVYVNLLIIGCMLVS